MIAAQSDVPPPKDSVDSIPDRAAQRPVWKYVLLGALFVLWIAILLVLFLMGKP